MSENVIPFRAVVPCAVHVKRWSDETKQYGEPEPCGEDAVTVVNDGTKDVPCCAHHAAKLRDA